MRVTIMFDIRYSKDRKKAYRVLSERFGLSTETPSGTRLPPSAMMGDLSHNCSAGEWGRDIKLALDEHGISVGALIVSLTDNWYLSTENVTRG